MSRFPLFRFLRLLPLAGFLAGGSGSAQERPGDLLDQPGVDLANPALRNDVAERMQAMAEERRLNARARAEERGLPVRVTRPDGVTQEIADFEGDAPIYLTTHNANAAISTGANLVRSTYGVQGAGITIGMWDGGSGRASHQEFGSRMVVMDGSAAIDHATHVGGTLAAAGAVASARGMAPAASVDSYDWNSDISEMTSRAASAPGQAGKIYLSNHSYGYVSGWNYVNNGTRVWEWYGNGTTAGSTEQDFGRYNTYSREQDVLAYNAPYYLIFRSAGNERVDNPSLGQKVALSPGSSTVVNFDPALHPAGDGQYRGGFETISFAALAKNVMTVGSVADAVTGGLRDPAKANSSNFSSWGPTDDGRIKPDVVANGDGVYSALSGSNTSYGTYSGTSMSSPNAAGSAALLIHHHGNLFPGEAMRASTLKSLIIHTADDLGNPGPDYKFGWGLVNAKAAADLLADHHAYPEKQRLAEDVISTSVPTRTYTFVWDGSSPLRATLGWTDPAGAATSTSDLRSPRLVNDLNLRIIAPGGAVYHPYVMPFVGTWTQASMNSAATTGINNTDNVEQVFIANPPAAGTYQLVVSHAGNLTNNSQHFSLLLSGSSAEPPPPPPLTISGVSPSGGLPGTVVMELTGTGFTSQTDVKLARSGHPDIMASAVQLIGDILHCEIDLTGAAAGAWSVVATNPGDETFTLADAFTVTGALWSENFDGPVTVWSSQATLGSNSWNLTAALSHSPTRSYFATAPATKTTTRLVSPTIPIPVNASDLQLKFWHDFTFQAAQDGGRLEFSVDGGPWISVDASGSGTSFASNGYNTRINNSGNPSNRSEFADLWAWSGNSGGFIETIVNLNDTAKFAGKTLRLRWSLATNAGTASHGWYVDSVALVGGGNLSNQKPVITAAATTSTGETVTDPDGRIFEVVRTASTGLSVGAMDDGGEAGLTYTWTVAAGGPVFFFPNAGNAAKSTTADFEAIGDYRLIVAVRDTEGLTTTSEVDVRVVETASGLAVDPATTSLPVGSSAAFQAKRIDQFGNVMAGAPAVTWSASGGGLIDSSGVFLAQTAGGPFAIAAMDDAFSATASITVTPAQAVVSLGHLGQTYDGTERAASVSTTPPGLAVAVTYNESFDVPVAAGSYVVEANVIDPNYQGSATGELVVAKAAAGVNLTDLSTIYDGNPKPAGATTTPVGLDVVFAYGGSSEPPTDAGSYDVIAVVSDANHEGSVTGNLTIAKATAIVDFTDLSTIYDGNPKPAGATTTPAGLDVVFTYDGSSEPPTDAGSYEVIAAVSDANHEGAATGNLTISKATATVDLSGLSATFDGTPKLVGVTTTPEGLAVEVNYDGGPEAPDAIGTYVVQAVVTDGNYQGEAEGELVISGLTFAEWGINVLGEPHVLSGAADPHEDPDGDGLTNLAEFALGTDPIVFTPPPVYFLNGDAMTLTFTRPKGLADVTYQVEASTTMAGDDWSPVPLEIIAQDAKTETLRTLPIPPAEQPDRLFLRLRFSLISGAEE